MADIEFDPELHMANPDGTPRLTNAGRPMKKRGRVRGVTGPSRRPAAAPGAGGARKAAGTDYRPGINGLFQMISVPLAFTAPADAAAVAHHGPLIADAVNDLARERPEVAAALERILSVGPYGALLAAVMPLAVQLLHNHGVIPEKAAVAAGATPKRVILDSLKAQAAEFGEAA